MHDAIKLHADTSQGTNIPDYVKSLDYVDLQHELTKFCIFNLATSESSRPSTGGRYGAWSRLP
jgi:hypothetical protein